MSGAVNIWGYIRPLYGQTQVGSIRSGLHLHGAIATGGQIAPGAFKDFALYPNGAVDPAMSYLQHSNAGTSSVDNTNAPTNFARAFIKAAAPADYPASGGTFLWRRAAYAGLGVRFKGMINNASTSLHYVDGWQDEIAALGDVGPALYSPARSLTINVQPNRLNLILDPKCSGSSEWSSTNPATVTSSMLTQPGYLAGSTSVQQVQISANGGASVAHGYTTRVSGLEVGAQYVVHGRVLRNPAVGTIHLVPTDGTPVISEQSTTTAALDPDNPKYQRVWSTFVATAAAATVGFVVYGSDFTTTPVSFLMAGAVCELGSAPGFYFDGDTDTSGDYMWESGQSANAARSFYYEDRIARSSLLTEVLQDNVPMGIPVSAPIFGVFNYAQSPAYWILSDPTYSILGKTTLLA
jgi:hypothetical protein